MNSSLELIHKITRYYLGEPVTPPLPNLSPETFDNLTDMITDAYIWYGGHKHAEWAAQHGDNVYQYMFDYKVN